MKNLILTLCLLGIACETLAAELQLREQAVCTGPFVMLHDVAEIHRQQGEDEAELASIDLLPTPPTGEQRVLRAREVQDLLALRGINLVRHRFSGASQVIIRRPKRDIAVKQAAAIVPAAKRVSVHEMQDAVVTAIGAYLDEQSESRGWLIKLSLNEDTARSISALGDDLHVSGGAAPFTGDQQFTLIGGVESVAVEVAANVALPPMLVVATRSLPRGVVLQADDVKLQPGKPTEGKAEVFQSLEDVIGKESTRVITEGQIIDDRAVRRPLLVRRNEAVTVYARAGGINVRTTARTREDGSAGDLVTVETIEDRKAFLARVCGPQEVEVFAQAATVSREPSRTERSVAKKPDSSTAPAAPLPNELNAEGEVE